MKLTNMSKHLRLTTMTLSRDLRYTLKNLRKISRKIRPKKSMKTLIKMNSKVCLLTALKRSGKTSWREDLRMRFTTKRNSNK
jgi:hypothetical protein